MLGPGLGSVMIAVGLGYWGGFARVVRGQVLSLREWEFTTVTYSNKLRACTAARFFRNKELVEILVSGEI